MQRRYATGADEGGLSHTAMIDVVFLLLVFFLMVFAPSDRLAVLDVSGREGIGKSVARPVVLDVGHDDYGLDGQRYDLAGLRFRLGEIAPYVRDVQIRVVTPGETAHARLIGALDACAAHGLTNHLAVQTTVAKR